MTINKTDATFYFSIVVMVWAKIQDMVQPLVSHTFYSWLSIVFAAVAVISYAFYERINNIPPAPPTVS